MLFDVLTGLVNALLAAFCFAYPFRKRAGGKIGGLKLHCIAGCLLVPAALIHLGTGVFTPSPSPGWITLTALLLTAATGLLKRRFMKLKFCRYTHLLCACIFLLTFAVHAAQQIINLFFL